jgi:hypothetical protein
MFNTKKYDNTNLFTSSFEISKFRNDEEVWNLITYSEYYINTLLIQNTIIW